MVRTREDLMAAPENFWSDPASHRRNSNSTYRSKEQSMFYGGMHMYWWFFWVLIWISFFSFWMPMRRVTYRQMQSPMQLLQRRYAAGEITSEQYEEQRAKFIRDAKM
jgi:putative membrane protein